MIRLRQTYGAEAGRTFEFAEGLIRIGRMPDSDVSFDPETDLDASGRHAEIRNDRGHWVLIDAGSRNGTWLNGHRVKHAALSEEDEIEFGKGGPRLVVEELSDRTADRATERLSGTEQLPRFPVPPTEVPGLDGEVTETDIDIGDDGSASDATEEPARDTFRAGPPQSFTRYWVLAALLVVLAITSLFFIARERGATESLDEASVTRIQAEARKSLWHVNEVGPGEVGRPICLAFAVGPRLLATTATCLHAIVESQESGAAVSLGSDSEPVTVVRMWRHPDAEAGADVGLIRVDGDLPSALEIAAPEALIGLERGQSLIAFPDRDSALVTSVDGVRSRDSANSSSGALLEHSVRAQPGSPLLDEDGRVVALQVRPTSAMRADLIRALIAGLE